MEALPCPACRGELRMFEPNAARCSRCGGLWLSPTALAKRGAKLGADLVAAATDAPRDCPICHTSMTTYRSPLVEIDACERCTGTFLDRGELEILVRAHRPNASPSMFTCESCQRELPRAQAVIGADKTLCTLCAERDKTLHAPDQRRQAELMRRQRAAELDDAIAKNRGTSSGSGGGINWDSSFVAGALWSLAGFVIEVLFDLL